MRLFKFSSIALFSREINFIDIAMRQHLDSCRSCIPLLLLSLASYNLQLSTFFSVCFIGYTIWKNLSFFKISEREKERNREKYRKRLKGSIIWWFVYLKIFDFLSYFLYWSLKRYLKPWKRRSTEVKALTTYKDQVYDIFACSRP